MEWNACRDRDRLTREQRPATLLFQ
ncbi:uncharacterized protein METZ01_LOCUS293050 [marine metagenome]|uniref:Uncharacterized protein n=1 Tax=marine metagenome TaxID=408172 RepID=A0A382LUH3_9ZZZZ